mmetsp:Transcript_6677/g.24989  ORF Transcript_6677/g.24989 Transcript_6677/m.24989 type:complete len:769 (-) Transcript_6677:135-2441(-)
MSHEKVSTTHHFEHHIPKYSCNYLFFPKETRISSPIIIVVHSSRILFFWPHAAQQNQMYTLTHHRCASLESRIQTILSSYQASLTSPNQQSLLDAPPSPIVRAFAGASQQSNPNIASSSASNNPFNDQSGLFSSLGGEGFAGRVIEQVKDTVGKMLHFGGGAASVPGGEEEAQHTRITPSSNTASSQDTHLLNDSLQRNDARTIITTTAPDGDITRDDADLSTTSLEASDVRPSTNMSLLDRRRHRDNVRNGALSPLPSSLRASTGNRRSKSSPLPKHHPHSASSSLLYSWEKRRKSIREFADRFPNVAAIFEAERLISKQIKDQLQELLLVALQCSEALNYYSALRYRSMLYRLTHTTPWHWLKQLGRWIASKKTLSVAQEEMDKATALEQLLDEICTRIGELNCELLNRFDNVSNVDEAYDVLVHFSLFVYDTYLRTEDDSEDNAPNIESVRDMLEIIDQYERYHVEWIAEKRKHLKESQVPSYISRHWIYYTTFSLVSFGICRYLYNNYDTLQPMVAHSADLVWQNVNQRLLVPMKEAYHIIRFEDKQTMIDAHKLETSRETLAHMVQNYLRDTGYGENMKMYVTKAYNGDISPVMENYTQHIRSPILCSISTPLITEMLIQMQSLQVDMLKIMSGIGDVMTSNALNMELMALVPVVILVSGISLSVVLYQKNQDTTVQNNIKDHLLAMDKIINSNLHAIGGLSAREHGKVFFHSSCCLMHSTTVYDQMQQKTLFADYTELSSPELSMIQKYNVVQRIYKQLQTV